MGKIELKEGHLEILSRISRSITPLYAIDFVRLDFSSSALTNLFKWGLVKTLDDALETLGPYQLTNMGTVYLEKILRYANKEL